MESDAVSAMDSDAAVADAASAADSDGVVPVAIGLVVV
jgi:hypothetical protein